MFDPLIHDRIAAGAVPVEKVDTPITLHDPCHSTRLAGMGDAMRALLNSVTNNFVEMTPNREHNYCCNGGAGGMRLPENTATRREISQLKAIQIHDTGAEEVTTPCVVCMLSLEDTCQTYRLAQPGERMATMLFEVVYEAMERGLARAGQLDRFRMPLELRERDPDYFAEHSASGVMAALMESPEAPAILEWLEQDEVVQRHARSHPEIGAQLQQFRELADLAGDLAMCLPPQARAVGSDTIAFI
jgi:hypothetical protein